MIYEVRPCGKGVVNGKYEVGFKNNDGEFKICSFWQTENGAIKEAKRLHYNLIRFLEEQLN